MSPLLRKLLLPFTLTATLAASPHDFEVDGIYYRITSSSTNTVAVTYCGDSYSSYLEYSGSVVIPSSVDYNGKTYSVTAIGSSTFRNCPSLASVEIPNSVTSIGDSAFGSCSSLASVEIPNSATSIGEFTFYDCSSLVSVDIPNSVTSIGNSTFRNCYSLASVEIPNSVSSIGNGAFRNCSSLTSVEIPNSVTSIGEYAFYDCASLASVEIPGSVTSIGYSAFYGCRGLNKSAYPSSIINPFNSGVAIAYPTDCHIDEAGVIYDKDITKVYYAPITLSEGYTIPKTITTIGDCAFSDCASLASVEIPNSVTSIGSSAFRNCVSLASVEIPKPVTAIGGGAFYGCTSLEHLAFNATNCTPCGSSNYSAFPTSISSLTIGNNVTKIPDYFLCNGSNIQNLTIPNSVTSIGDHAFYCHKLLSVTLGSGLLSIGSSAFTSYNHRIAKAFWLGNTPPTGGREVNAYANYVSNDQYYYLNNQIKYQFLSSKFTVDGIVYVPVSPSERTCDVVDCLYNNVNTTDVVSDKVANKGIEMTVNKIQQYAFYRLSTISEINIPNSITYLGASAFEGCSGLKSATLGTGFPSLPTRVFSGCSSLESISIPNNVTSIADYAFESCSSLADISIADSDSEISLGSNGSSPLFADCPLDEVYIGRKLSYKTGSNYGYSPFYRNTSLRTVEITDAETEIYDNEFYGCSGLNSLKIGNGVKKIGKWAFSGCSSLDYFSAGYKVESIGDEAFSDCTGLTKYYSYSIVPPVCGNQALDDINKWECALYVPAESSDEYKAAPQWKDFFFVEEMSAVLVAAIELNTTEAEVNVGSTLQLSATILPANATNQALVWESSDVSVADVNGDGLITGLKEGTATITAQSADGNAEATCVLTVKDMSGIDTVNAPSAYTLVKTPNGYIVRNACGARIEVYSADGRMVYLAPTYAEEEIALPAGLYIVRAANRAWKVRF